MLNLDRRTYVATLMLAALPIRASASSEPASVVEDFHRALAAGDRDRALSLLWTDAAILEGGALESRADYAAHHLDADIAFAKAVPSKRSRPVVTIEGSVAWVHSTFTSNGVLNGKPLAFAGAELMVLTRMREGWRIRAIHWSSRSTK